MGGGATEGAAGGGFAGQTGGARRRRPEPLARSGGGPRPQARPTGASPAGGASKGGAGAAGATGSAQLRSGANGPSTCEERRGAQVRRVPVCLGREGLPGPGADGGEQECGDELPPD